MRRYFFICYVVFVYVSPLSGSFPVSCPIPDFYAKIPAFYADILCYLRFYTRYHTWCVMVGGGSLCGKEASADLYVVLPERTV